MPSYSKVPDLRREGALTSDLIPGTLLGAGRDYRVVRELGRGTTGAVYLVADLSLDRLVAVKILLPQLRQNHEQEALLRREARLLASIRHEHVVCIYDVGEFQRTPFLIMEYVDGDRLRRQTCQKCSLTLTLQLCKAVAAMHEAGVAHCDIKPANVLVTTDGRTVLMDFGHAKSLSEWRSCTNMVGTADYLAPELAFHGPQTPEQAIQGDVYALGMTFYEFFAGRLPFPSGETYDVLRMHATQDPIPPSTQSRDIK